MLPETRAMIAAAAYAFVAGKKVAGVFDHSAKRDLQIAAESRGTQLQGFDGDRAVKFGGTLPEIYDTGAEAFVSMEIDGAKVRGHDRGADHAYSAQVTDHFVQLYDYGESAWFTFDIRGAEPGYGYHRGAEASS
ncbi:hypothetical protein [Novosphingobium sp. PhB57]|jgi:hypothetical protein|uniref:hypothetical protein n=2 Tax=Novosphingobium TaxID=165696 RepID=UPI00104C69D6|nr:hypothetical protein [Novosphingobium sp. PhB57]